MACNQPTHIFGHAYIFVLVFLLSSTKASPAHGPRGNPRIAAAQLSQLSHLDLEELDLLPTKEEVIKVEESPKVRQDSTQWSLSPLDESPGLSGGTKV